MSAESLAIFHAALHGQNTDPEELRAAAIGHLGASRPLSLLQQIYAEAVAAGEYYAANQIADELQPVRAAQRAAAMPEAED